MGITKKIEEIRRQPEHVRLRWVWSAVAVSMTFIFLIWLFSLQTMFQQDAGKASEGGQDIGETLNKIKESAPSIKDVPLTGQATDAGKEGIQDQIYK